MAKTKQSFSLSDDAKLRFGILSGLISLLFLVAGVLGFLSDAKTFEGLDFGTSAGVMGWYGVVLSLLFGGVALVLGVLIKGGD